uniref:Uncharacterized protein n=1 Tax=Anguilla anguilla TaxID=7936 RepID=A0A0E9VUD5_ANGAN
MLCLCYLLLWSNHLYY